MIEPAPPHPERLPDEYNVFAILSMSCGILGLFVLQIALAPAAIVFGALGVHSAKQMPSTRRLAVAGYALGMVDGVLWLALVTLFQAKTFPL